MERLEIEESSEGLLTKHNKFLSKKVHQASVFSCICFILIIVALIILLVFTIRILIVLYQQKGVRSFFKKIITISFDRTKISFFFLSK